jgi:hypothetical protein
MTTVAPEKSIEELIHIVRQINLSWREGKPEKLEEYFHERMMIVSADLKILGDGKEQCINSYREFIGQAHILEYKESEPEIHIWGTTAIAWYNYEMNWKMNGDSYEESGKDLFVFTSESGKWMAIWRKVMPD